ncbi:MAG: hypothetical protein K2G45_12645 [Lachnospiraceae bacterium]|nr:hypothetical protein [Lachnospiraceae bacterium]
MKKYRYLNPIFMIIPGKKFFEKYSGKKDVQENQVCKYMEGHTTPEIDSKVNSYSSHINKIFLNTVKELEPMVQEANSMVIELNLLLAYKLSEPTEEIGEEAQRQAAIAIVNKEKMDRRKREILTRLAEIRAESDMVDEMLLHYIERAEGILYARVSKYWCGVLSASDGNLEHFPVILYGKSAARESYTNNKKKLVEMIDSAISYGGGTRDEEKNEEFCG